MAARRTATTRTPEIDPGPRPVQGDHVTRYTYDQSGYWLGITASTLRHLVNSGRLPRRFTSRLGGKVFMTGDQIVQALAYSAREDELPTPEPVERRRRRRVNT